MLIRKNTKAFKTVRQIIEACKDRSDREKLVRLYITKAGHSIAERISIEGIQGDTSFFYDMNYQTILSNLDSANHQLHVSDDVAGIYFFHSSSNKVWDEAPFEFDEAVINEFKSLPDVPVVRKKEKVEKYVFPTPKAKKSVSEKKPEKTDRKKSARTVAKGPEQPRFKLKYKITFSNLDKTIYRKKNVSKLDVLNYYNGIAEHILPHLKDRPVWSKLAAGSFQGSDMVTPELLFRDDVDSMPNWMKPASAPGEKDKKILLANDREHLLYYVESGLVQFEVGLSKIKSIESPDYIVVTIESPDSELGEAITVAKIAHQILTGLELPSFVKTDGQSGLHVYIPLDSKTNYELVKRAANYICKLIMLRLPGKVATKDAGDHAYGKVVLDFHVNDGESGVIAPYSLLYHEEPIVATPIFWNELNDELRADLFNHETVVKRLKRVGDPFKDLFKKKIDAEVLLERLDKHYSFLFDEESV